MTKIEGKKNSLGGAGKIGVFAFSLLATVFAVYLYSPVIGSHADSRVPFEVSVGVESDLSLTASSPEVNMSANINSFTHSSVDLTVKTNSPYGYTISIEDADADTNMNHAESSVTDVVVSNFTGAKTSVEMDNNTWGFSLDDGENYYRIPVFGMPTLIARDDSVAPGTAVKTVDFGAKVGVITSGVYSDTVLFTAYTNGMNGYPDIDLYEKGTETKIDKPALDKPYMQGFSCDSLEIGKTIELYDIRDYNTYQIVRLNDGNCWMKQGLRIIGKTLTPEDSNVTSPFVLNRSNLENFGWNPNDYIANLNNDAVYKQRIEGFGTLVVYSWHTATAGSSENVDYDTLEYGEIRDTQYSICPSGWHMPSYSDLDNLSNNIYPGTIIPMYDNAPYGLAVWESSDGTPDPDFDSNDSYWWTSSYGVDSNWTVNGTSYDRIPAAYTLNQYESTNDGNVYTRNSLYLDYPFYGAMVRCMANGTAPVIPDPAPAPDPDPGSDQTI